MKLTFILFLFILTAARPAYALPEHELRDSIVCFASDHLGIPYHYGGTTTAGFDCTGFVYYVFKHFGIAASRASSGYENAGEFVEKECAQPGDVILFTGTNSEIRKVGHAGIIYENANGILYFIHSSSSKNHFGVTITQLNSSAGYQKRFLRIIDIL